jgi:NAD(P)H-hydrate epimerase
MDADAGALFSPCVHAAATLSLTLPLRGLVDAAARQAYGDLYLGDVGVPWALLEELGLTVDAIFGRDPLLRWDVVDGVAQLTG